MLRQCARSVVAHLQTKPVLRQSAALLSTSQVRPHTYTQDNPLLSNDQRDFYEKNGFVLIQDLVPHAILDECKDRFVEVVEKRAINPAVFTKMKDISMKNEEGIPAEQAYNKIQDILYDDVLSKYCSLPQILDYVECFTGPGVAAIHSMLINKPPDVGTQSSRHPVHQDMYYFPLRPSDLVVGVWTAMEQVHKGNGCLFAIPGSHTLDLLAHGYPKWEGGVNRMFHGVKGFDDHPLTYLEMQKGDTLFFHPHLLHGSGANTTKSFRKAISVHYASTACHYLDDVSNTVQEVIAAEALVVAKKKGADCASFAEYFRLKSRRMRGTVGNLF